MHCYPSCSFARFADDALQTSTIDDINDSCKEEGEDLFEYTKTLLEKTKIEEVNAAMKLNGLESKLESKSKLPTNLSSDDEIITKICIDTGRADISFVRILIDNDKALLFKRELKDTFSDKIAAFGKH